MTPGEVGEKDDDRDEPVAVPPFFLPPSAGDRRRPEERSQAGELLAEEDTAWDPGARPVAQEAQDDGELPPDYVGVVREAEDDFGSWDAELWGDDDPSGPAEEEDDDPGWSVPEAPAAVIPPPPEPDEPPRVRPRPSGQSYEAILLSEMPLRAGGPDLDDDQRREIAEARLARIRQDRIDRGLDKDDDEDEEEPPERRAADLLHRDDTAWSGRGDDTVNGVIG